MTAPTGPAAAAGPNAALIGRPGSRHELETPALVLDLDVLTRNIEVMAEHARARGYQLRPCFKVYKSVEIARRQVTAGALGICCATLAEAEAAALAGIASVLLFTTVVTPGKLERLAALNVVAEELIVATDEPGNVSDLAEAARRSGRALKVMADFDMGGGRTGARGVAQTVALARLIADTPGLHYAGLQAYNGQILAIPDYAERRRAALECLAPVREVIARLTAEGLAPQIVSGGGTGTYDIDPDAAVFTEIQAGTYVVMDVSYGRVHLRPEEPEPFGQALTVCASVVSAPGGGYVITDGGGKEIDGVFAELQPVIRAGAPEGSRYSIVGDDLGRIDLPPGGEAPRVGDRVTLVPPHAWQTVPMYRVYHCVSGDTLVDIWPVDGLSNL
jgi:3-hydroxy-D-aspartate aldolase